MNALRLSAKKLNSHTGVFADTGGGKTLFIQAYLREVERHGDVAIVWDPDRQHTPKFRNVARGDWELDPTSAAVPWWDMGSEYRDEGEAHALSMCFFPDNPTVRDPFWNNSARLIATIAQAIHHPDADQLASWFANDEELDEKLQGTEGQRILTNNAPGMRSSIISHLNLIAQPLRMMPTRAEKRRRFSVREWCERRDSWVFITSQPQYTAILNPLHAFFLSSFIQRLIAMGPRKDLPRVHIIFEEAATVVIQEFHLGLVRLRKTNNPVLYAIQNNADLKAIHGERAETIYSQPYYKVFFRLASPDSAKLAAGTIGQKQIMKMRETWTAPRFGLGAYRRSFTFQPELASVVPEYVLQNLEDRSFYIISPGKIAKGKMPIFEMPDRLPLIQQRLIPPILRQPLKPTPKEPIPYSLRDVTEAIQGLTAALTEKNKLPAPPEEMAIPGQNHF